MIIKSQPVTRCLGSLRQLSGEKILLLLLQNRCNGILLLHIAVTYITYLSPSLCLCKYDYCVSTCKPSITYTFAHFKDYFVAGYFFSFFTAQSCLTSLWMLEECVGPFTLQPWLAPRLVPLGLGTGWCTYICGLDQTGTSQLTSLFLQMRRLSAALQTTTLCSRQRMMYDRMMHKAM